MKYTGTIFAALMIMAATVSANAAVKTSKTPFRMKAQVVRISTYESSTAVNFVVVKPQEAIDDLDPSAFVVNTNGVDREVRIAYRSDDRGAWEPDGGYIAFGLAPSTEMQASPRLMRGATPWNYDYKVTVALKPKASITAGGLKYTAIECEDARPMKNFLSESDYFRRGSFTGPSTNNPGDETLTYAAYEPWALQSDGARNPLIIWVHGAGEGGTDVSLELMGNEVVALIRDDIQSHFTTEGGEGGAYVLTVQCPTMWMDGGKGYTHGEVPSRYLHVLKGAIDRYVAENPDVDRSRIYIGGCSNGGYMTISMLIHFPRFFAAAYPICEAYDDGAITENEISLLAKENVWFVQSFDDTTVKPEDFCIATYKRLMEAGAPNVWMSMFETVIGTDTPGQRLYGHLSWVYAFNDQVTAAQKQTAEDPVPTNMGGGTESPQGFSNIFDWMNAQTLK